MISNEIRANILNTLENRDKLIDEIQTLDSSPFSRYIYKIKTWEPERLKRNLTRYKLLNLQQDFYLEEGEQFKLIKLLSNTSRTIQYFKNLFYPLNVEIFFRASESYSITDIEKLLENPIDGFVKNIPEPSKIRATYNWFKTELKIDDEKEFSSKMDHFKTEYPTLEIFAIYRQPTIKTYAWILSGIAAFAARYVYDLVTGNGFP